jgi:uncharacterized membrane protein required for colicin V production
LISFSTVSYTVTFLPSTTSLTLLPLASFLGTFAETLTVSKLSFSLIASVISFSACFFTSFALASVVTILPMVQASSSSVTFLRAMTHTYSRRHTLEP